VNIEKIVLYLDMPRLLALLSYRLIVAFARYIDLKTFLKLIGTGLIKI